MNLFKKSIISLWALIIISSAFAQHTIDANYGDGGVFGPITNNLKIKDMIRSKDKGQYIISQIGANYELPFIAKLNPEGALDSTFNEDGAIIQWFMDDRHIIGLAESPTNSDSGFFTLYQGNDTTDLKNDLMIMKFTEDGEIDTTWSDDGFVQISPPASSIYDYEYHSITTHLIGPAIIVTGVRKSSGTCDELFFYGLTSSGIESIGFGVDGLTTIAISDIVGESYPLCAYNIKAVNEKGGSLVASLENSDGDSSFCIARANPVGDGTLDLVFPDQFTDTDLDYTTVEGLVFINQPLLFTDYSHNIVEQSSFLDWVVAFQEDNVSLLLFNILDGLQVHRNLDLPTDATYNDISARVDGYGAYSNLVYLTGERNNQVHIASIALCGENTSVQSNELALDADPNTGLFLVNQNGILPSTDSLVVLFSDDGNTSFSTVRVLGNSNCLETAITETQLEIYNFKVYPNPVSGRTINVEMKFEREASFSISLVGLNAQKIHVLLGNNNYGRSLKKNFSLPDNISPGVYLLTVESDSKVYSDKIIIQ